MGFNFGAFIGGASDNLVEMIKTKEAQLYKEEQDEKERIRKARVAAANQRRADEQEAKAMAEGLSLFYSQDQVQDILAKGKTAGKYALSYAENMVNKGYDPSAGYAMPKTTIQSEFAFDINDPRGSQVSPQMAEIEAGEVERMTAEAEAQPFISRFTQPPKESEMTKAKTFEARLVELDFQRTNAPNADKRAEFDAAYNETLSAYKAFKEELDGKGTDTDGIKLGTEARGKIVDNAIERVFDGVAWAERDITGRIKLAVTGNEANSFELRKRAVADLRQQAIEYNDKTLNTMIDGIESGYKADIEAKKQQVYRAHLGNKRAAADENIAADSFMVAQSKKFKAMPEGGRTKEDVIKQAAEGAYTQNDVVAYTDAQGNFRLALVSDYGIFF